MIFVLDLPAVETFIAAIGGDAVGAAWIKAVERLGQRASHQFQFLQRIAREKIGMTQPSARQRTLEQLDALRLLGKIFEGHAFR